MLYLMFASAFLATNNPACASKITFYQPKLGVIISPYLTPKIAELYLSEIYGLRHIQIQKPFNVRLEGDVWNISGTRRVFMGHASVGGFAEIDMRRSNGQVIRIYHGK